MRALQLPRSKTTRLLLIAGLVAGLLITSVGIFAANPKPVYDKVTLTIPKKNQVKKSDFAIQAVAQPKPTRGAINTEVYIDGYLVMSNVTNQKPRKKKGAKPKKYVYKFGLGSTKSGTTTKRHLFPRTVLKPGKHTVVAVMRTGNKPGKGKLIQTSAVKFKVQSTVITTSQSKPVTIAAPKPGEKVTGARRSGTSAGTAANSSQASAAGLLPTAQAQETDASSLGTDIDNEIVSSPLTAQDLLETEPADNDDSVTIEEVVEVEVSNEDLARQDIASESKDAGENLNAQIIQIIDDSDPASALVDEVIDEGEEAVVEE